MNNLNDGDKIVLESLLALFIITFSYLVWGYFIPI